MITLLQLQYFVALASQEHVTKAASELLISPTTLTCVINKLEHELGVELFEHKGRNIKLNRFGIAYLKYANEILEKMSDAQNILKEMKGEERQVLSLAMTSSIVWSSVISDYQIENPNCMIVQQDIQPEQFKSKLLSHELDFVIAGLGDFSSSGLDYKVFCEESIHLVMLPSHHLATRKDISINDLQGLPFINISRDHPFSKFCERIFHNAGLELNSVFECDYTMRPHMLQQGIGVAITTSRTLETMFWGENVSSIPVTNFGKREMALYWLKDRHMTEVMRSFSQYLFSRQTRLDKCLN